MKTISIAAQSSQRPFNVPAEPVAAKLQSAVRAFARYAYVPFVLVGMNGLAVYLTASHNPLWVIGLLIPLGMAITFVMEHALPYEQTWNESHGDRLKDAIHNFAYELTNGVAILLLPALVTLAPWKGFWPTSWPLVIQLLMAVFVIDLGMTMTHFASHRIGWLWKFHSVHHGVGRLYGFNGLVRHPLHQCLDLAIGALPLSLAGMPVNVAALLGAVVSLQLVVQHSNVDYRVGPFERILSIGPVHRLHHVNWAGEGDVNFGLFFTMWDRLLGTFTLSRKRMPRAGDIGVQDQSSFPQAYVTQLLWPFVS
jgi:sterol desaturase/sphingolipid hydroxylase (fatty acid hydroxylase superfamily)